MKIHSIEQAVDLLAQGEIVAIPTETVYGLAADITQPAAIKKVFALKNRPTHHPLIVHVGHKNDIEKYATHIPDEVRQLIQHFWPGPLTFLFDKKPCIDDLITGNQSSVAIRMPAHPVALEIIQRLGHPIAAPSANRFGHTSPTMAEHVIDEFENTVTVVDGGRCMIGMESTILDVRQKNYATVARQGMLSATEINEFLGKNWIIPHEKTSREESIPGNLASHYAPHKPLYLFQTNDELIKLKKEKTNNLYIIHWSDILIPDHFMAFKMPNEASAYAYQLYFQLRIADQSNADAIALELPPLSNEKWQAIHDKLQRAKS